MPPKRTITPISTVATVARYLVGRHQIQVSRTEGRWAVIVDDTTLSSWFMTQAEAWAAGVHEADRLDRLA